MKLKKIFDIAKKKKAIDILNVSGAVLFSYGGSVWSVRDLPAICSLEEFGAMFEIPSDELSAWDVSIDEERNIASSFSAIGRGIPIERGGTFSFGSLRCVLFKKAEQRQLSFDESEESSVTDLSGYVAIDPEKLSPIRDGIISFEYIPFLGVGCVCAFENGTPVAVIEPEEINSENIEFLTNITEGLSAYYKSAN